MSINVPDWLVPAPVLLLSPFALSFLFSLATLYFSIRTPILRFPIYTSGLLPQFEGPHAYTLSISIPIPILTFSSFFLLIRHGNRETLNAAQIARDILWNGSEGEVPSRDFANVMQVRFFFFWAGSCYISYSFVLFVRSFLYLDSVWLGYIHIVKC
jgi:hypothetical protein